VPRTFGALATVLGLTASGVSGCAILYSTDAISSEPRQGDGGDAGGDGGAGAGDSEGGAGGPSLCDASTFVFCDGFEDGLGATSGANGGGVVTVDSTHVRRGAFALHSSMPATTRGSNMGAGILHGQAWPAHVFVRFFAFFPSPCVVGIDLLSYLDATSAGLVLYILPGDPKLGVSNFGVPDAGSAISSTRLPLGEWVCLELEVDSAAHRLNVWMNDNALGDLSQQADVGKLNLLGVGLGYGNASDAWPPYQAWFDEVAVDANRIGCAR
jgi:hypothetical protein